MMEEINAAGTISSHGTTSTLEDSSKVQQLSVTDWKELCHAAKLQLDEIRESGCQINPSHSNNSKTGSSITIFCSETILQSRFIPIFPSVQTQINIYLGCLSTPSDPNSSNKRRCTLSEVTRATRHALQYLRICLIPEWNFIVLETEPDDDPLFAAQVAAIQCDLHIGLVQLLCYKDSDARCRNEASKALCNLVTTNVITSEKLLQYTSTSITTTTTTTTEAYSWIDMITTTAATSSPSAQSIHRNILAQVVATLYNCLSALEKSTNALDNNSAIKPTSVDVIGFTQKLVKEKRLIHILLCSISPSTTVPLKRNALSVGLRLAKENSGNDEPLLNTPPASPTVVSYEADSATEWIFRLLMGKLAIQYDLLPSLYESLSLEYDDRQTKTTDNQVIFLSFLLSYMQDTNDVALCCIPYHECWKASLRYLDAQTTKLGRSTLSLSYERGDESDTTACIYMLRILASSVVSIPHLSNNDHIAAEMRFFLGQETSLIRDICQDLAAIVDKVTISNQGKRTREIQMSDYDQTLVILYVQIVANLSFQCKIVQDLLRQVIICEPRTGLHIIMSCTSLSYACVGLREWAIVAMRNLLENNTENQRELESLSPQETVSSDALASLGFGIDLDSKGRVKVVPPTSDLNNLNNEVT